MTRWICPAADVSALDYLWPAINLLWWPLRSVRQKTNKQISNLHFSLCDVRKSQQSSNRLPLLSKRQGYSRGCSLLVQLAVGTCPSKALPLTCRSAVPAIHHPFNHPSSSLSSSHSSSLTVATAWFHLTSLNCRLIGWDTFTNRWWTAELSLFLHFPASSLPILPPPPPPNPPPLPLQQLLFSSCRVLMESHSNDSRDRGHHWWNPRHGHITADHRSSVLLSAAGKAAAHFPFLIRFRSREVQDSLSSREEQSTVPRELCLFFVLLQLFHQIVLATLNYRG